MSYLLDTNACIRYLNSSNNPVFYRLNSLPPDDIFLCDIVKFELYYGAYKSSNRDKNLATLKIFFDEFVSLPFDGQSADICGYIRSELNKKGTPIGVYDLQIASIALANNLVLVTHNVGEFSRVEGLQYEDWEVAV
ncbi:MULTISPECIES: type II toxin-antitoxin system VapC family toxin [Nostoc]|uniref:Type II toxin-antitoxin system VapC family toxin n=2 Tax=Nostoc TaxID=1177 RepID=A0ABR8IJB5_9NOSO|nr:MULTISPECIES: type II toxin-antitoxin system VapC family toxin [Nostoc]MBD2565609.1 type II toxin-antitoxin system VapC family toxin [Nostoc linckia FACHB-391]MBD2651066.1 type II toxin-antitoxin system VapC family toxin [Nostoc foliaceum FACHB-393]